MGTVRLSDYVIDRVAREGVDRVFMVSGGGGMFLIDSLGRRKDVAYTCNHHEQASVMSAEGYQRVRGGLGAALVTTGPAGTNAITGVMCAWNDSIPLLVLSGQANSRFLIGDTGMRQRGVHEADIVRIVSSVTKYAVTVTDASTIRYHLEKALFLAQSGRPGPVWLDIPLDVQSKEIDPATLAGFDAAKEFPPAKGGKGVPGLPTLAKWLAKSVRPVVLAGHGIRLGGAHADFLRFVESHRIPVVTTKNALDLVHDGHPLLAGRIGINGQRAGNLAVQNADLVIAVGSRLAFPTVGYATDLFAREARIVAVDVDPVQLSHPVIRVDLPVLCDAKRFLEAAAALPVPKDGTAREAWIARCRGWRRKYPPVLPEWRAQRKYVDPYHFFERLSAAMGRHDTLVTDQGATFYCSTVAFKVKEGQRVFTNGGFSPMGYGLPAAVGACFAAGPRGRVVCASGDGGLEMNIQELQTIVHYKLPLKLFVFNNQGYLSIKHTQNAYFDGFLVGSDPGSGVSCPDTLKIAKGYGIPAMRIRNHRDLDARIREALAADGPMMVDVVLDPLQPFLPKVASERKPDGRMVSKPLEDMAPFLDRDEFRREMIVSPVEE
jgi:acetolactate synthase-1/2/3 large subunit